MHAAFSRLADRVFDHIGSDCVLRGGMVDQQAIRGIVDHDVEVIGEYGEVAMRRNIATLPSSACAKIGDTLTVGNDDYVIDAKMATDGITTKYMLR